MGAHVPKAYCFVPAAGGDDGDGGGVDVGGGGGGHGAHFVAVGGEASGALAGLGIPASDGAVFAGGDDEGLGRQSGDGGELVA